jgi:hypothetical protein
MVRLAVLSSCLVVAALAGAGSWLTGQGRGQPPTQPFRSRVVDVLGPDRVKMETGAVVRLQGIGLPDALVRPPSLALELKDALTRKTLWKEFQVTPETDPGPEVGPEAICTLLLAQHLGLNGNAATVNEELLADGLATLTCRTRTVHRLEHLLAASRQARENRRGWFGRTPVSCQLPVPAQRGAVLGLYYREEKYDYHRHLDELKELGTPWVSFLLTCFVDKVDSVVIRRDHERTVTDARLIETIRYARQKGFRLTLLPIVLILDADPADWRGTLRPSNHEKFWRSYDEFICHYADIAQTEGVELFSVGSEYCSLERDPDYTPAWTRIIHNVRGRYAGWVTYSANWDHVHVPKFWHLLDFAGMTAYFSVTQKTDPTLEELVAGWEEKKQAIAKDLKVIGKPYLFTEIGYPAIDGANKDPWDYVSNKSKLDLQEQYDATKAFVQVWQDAPDFLGAYLFDFFEPGGLEDSSYSPRGKPVLELWRQWVR